MKGTRKLIICEAKKALSKSYCKYSNIRIGATILTKNGKIFSGCNIENVSYSLAICAERVAIFNAVSEGYEKFDAIGIASSLNEPAFPCGSCRQVLAEFCPELDLKIFLENDKKLYILKDLIPNVFNNGNKITLK